MTDLAVMAYHRTNNGDREVIESFTSEFIDHVNEVMVEKVGECIPDSECLEIARVVLDRLKEFGAVIEAFSE